jgi:predicted MFS family arabinose efflux permease
MNSAYALAFIIGVPLGLYLANHFSWHAPFFLMSAQTAVVAVAGAFAIPSVRSHLELNAAAPKGTPIRAILTDATQLRALGLNGGLMFSAYAVTPFLATYMVSDLHFAEASIPTFYLVGGLFTLAAGVWFGLLADKHGSTRVFALITIASIGPTIWITQLETHSLALAIGVTTLFMATVTGRTVPALAMALTSVPAELRGGFMSLNSAFQQLCLGLGAVAAGSVLVEREHVLYRFGWCGAISAAASVVCVLLSIGLKDRPAEAEKVDAVEAKAAAS